MYNCTIESPSVFATNTHAQEVPMDVAPVEELPQDSVGMVALIYANTCYLCVCVYVYGCADAGSPAAQ